jgi:uncharacterized protein YllA (UPF0747 family)
MRIPLRRCPPTSALFVDYLENWPRVRPFYSQSYDFDSIERFARARPELESGHRTKLCAILDEQQSQFGSSHKGVRKLSSGAVAVVTGQQPALLTGSLLSIFKAISAIKIAARLEQAGVRAVPVFWVAAEDHDYEEIASTWVVNRNAELSRLSVDLSAGEPVPAGWLELKEDVRTALSDCLAQLPQSEFVPDLRRILEESYCPGLSPVTAFARMMARLFSDSELVFVNPLNEGLKSMAQRLIEAAIGRNAEMRSALIARNRALTAAGYHEQVKVDENFTGLFEYQGRTRQPLRPNDLRNSVKWSPNVLLRPLVQDALLPTVTYIGGPAEVAYLAQAAAIYETLKRPMPPIFPRISATLIEPRVARIAEKYAVSLEDVFQGREFLRRKAVSATADDSAFARVSTAVDAELDTLRPLLSAVDETLAGALDTSRQKMHHQVESLHGKYVHAVARRNEVIERHLDTICNSLFPAKKLQERVLNISSFVARYGFEIIPRLQERLSLDTSEHQVVEL